MAPTEFEVAGGSKGPTVVEPGNILDGIVTPKFFGVYRIRQRIYCAKDDLQGGTHIEILRVGPRLTIGPLKVFEKREIIAEVDLSVEKDQSRVFAIKANDVKVIDLRLTQT